jgi:hypothetical protein
MTEFEMLRQLLEDMMRDMIRIETRLCKLAIALVQEKVLGK